MLFLSFRILEKYDSCCFVFRGSSFSGIFDFSKTEHVAQIGRRAFQPLTGLVFHSRLALAAIKKRRCHRLLALRLRMPSKDSAFRPRSWPIGSRNLFWQILTILPNFKVDSTQHSKLLDVALIVFCSNLKFDLKVLWLLNS